MRSSIFWIFKELSKLKALYAPLEGQGDIFRGRERCCWKVGRPNGCCCGWKSMPLGGEPENEEAEEEFMGLTPPVLPLVITGTLTRGAIGGRG